MNQQNLWKCIVITVASSLALAACGGGTKEINLSTPATRNADGTVSVSVVEACTLSAKETCELPFQCATATWYRAKDDGPADGGVELLGAAIATSDEACGNARLAGGASQTLTLTSKVPVPTDVGVAIQIEVSPNTGYVRGPMTISPSP